MHYLYTNLFLISCRVDLIRDFVSPSIKNRIPKYTAPATIVTRKVDVIL